MDKVVLRKWLEAGYIEKAEFHSTQEGTPQGGIISPTLLIHTLTGLEQAAKTAATTRDKVNVVVYADDFIITGASKELLETKIKPAIVAFLEQRGLTLSEEKTHITHINDGFDFLGFNVRKYKNKLLIKPAKENIKAFLAKLKSTIEESGCSTTAELIRQLNPKIRGWSNYYRHVVSKRTFAYVDNRIFRMLWQWARRRHPNKSAQWCKQKYYRCCGLRNWVFSAKTFNKAGHVIDYDLAEASKVKIQRHIKIRGDANPYDPSYDQYFFNRERLKRERQARSMMDLDGYSTF